MDASFPAGEQLRSTWEISRGFLIEGLRSAFAKVGAGYHTEHNDDDTHSTITATGTISERGRTTPLGDWVVPAPDANRFSIAGAGNSWSVPADTPSLSALLYTLVGSTCYLQLDIPVSTLTIGTGTKDVSITLPTELVPNAGAGTSRAFVGVCRILNNATVSIGVLQVSSQASTLTIHNGVNYVSSSDFAIQGQIAFQIRA